MEIESLYVELGGRACIMELTGLSAQQLTDAKRAGLLPSPWYRNFKKIGDDLGFVVPLSLFRFNEPPQTREAS